MGTGAAERRSDPDPDPSSRPPGARPLWRSRGWQDQPQLPSHTQECVESQGGKKKPQGPKHFLQPQAVTYLLVHFKFKMKKKTPQNNPKPLGFSGWGLHHP